MNNIDYRDFIDIAKLNLIQKIDGKMKEYSKNQNYDTKKEIIDLLIERQKLFLFDIDTIKKYM